MRVLHYTLGFPPYRSGGLTKYAIDLMITEQGLGNNVCALYPGTISLWRKKCSIRRMKEYKGIKNFEIVNPLCVPLLYGTKKPYDFYNEEGVDTKSFIDLLDDFKPGVFHIHTLMGLPKIFMRIAKERGIKLVYTSHDYYGICSLVNLIDSNGKVCNDINNPNKCELCNNKSHGTWFLRIRNMKQIVYLWKILRQVKL